MTREVFIVYGGSGAPEGYTEPLYVATTEKDAKTWAFDNSNASGGRMNIKKFPIGGNGKPRDKKPASNPTPPTTSTAVSG